MTYLMVDYKTYYRYFASASFLLVRNETNSQGLMIYNYNVFFRNRTMSFVTKSFLGGLIIGSNLMIERYRK